MKQATIARALLFGQKPNTEITLGKAVWFDLLRTLGSDQPGKPSVGEYLKHKIASIWVKTEKTIDERLPEGWPSDVFAIIGREIEAKAGKVTLEDGASIPAFRLTPSEAAVLPHMWIAYIKPTSVSSDYKKVLNLDDSIEESLAQKNKTLTVRVMAKPLRVEVERPDAVTVSFADDWNLLKRQPQNAFEYVIGTYFAEKKHMLRYAELIDPNEAHAAIIGMSGSGKTQLGLSINLSLALNTSPELLSMIIIDPKGLEFRPLGRLPHLANGEVITDLSEAVTALRAVIAEMDRRTKAGDLVRTYKRIMLFIDEIPDLLDQDRNSGDDSLEGGLIRLLQKGQGVGINVFMATQQAKKEVMSTRILGNCSWRMIGSLNTFHDSAHASGQDGCLAHKLPGKGSFLMYNPEFRNGVRVQSHFVANSKKLDYLDVLNGFIDDICERWEGKQPHWTIGKMVHPEMVQDELPLIVEEKRGNPNRVEFEQTFILAMSRKYAEDNRSFSINTIRKAHKDLYGSECGNNRAKRLYDDIMIAS